MALARRQRSNQDIWPGFVDALASLLMVIIFLLMIFVVSQLYLNEEIVGRDKALERLQGRVAELADMLALERESAAELRTNLGNVTEQLRASLTRQDELESQIFELRGENASLAAELDAARSENSDLLSRLTIAQDDNETRQQRIADLETELEEAQGRIAGLEETRDKVSKDLEDAYKVIAADQERIMTQLGELAKLEREIQALISLRDELQGRLADEALALDESEKDLIAARAETALLNDQIQALNDQIAELNSLLETYEARDKAQQTQIVDLGKRLNVALAGKVQELARYRSEFFGKLREILGNRSDIRIVGDRFVFQSEVLFEKGAAELGPAGKFQLIDFANTLNEIAGRIPDDIDWVLQVNGHTDRDPINTAQFPSNWELSTARAISVVKFLESRGVDPQRMSAAGFAEYQPLDQGSSPAAYTRNRRIEMKFTNR
ncbi:peptidoglycan -binding protein [Pacificispira sp.]|uniref:peptidoglycan -binding protein n=1 Tax=Pacificispira sp. TaxID=2888761 RepID=UPI003BAC39AC